MSILACDRDPAALAGIVVEDAGRFWDLERLREHVRECRRCTSFWQAMTSATGSQGGMAGRGPAKRRGSTDYYRALARRRQPAA